MTVTLLLLYANIGTKENVFSLNFLKNLGNALLNGLASPQFWYIPFITIVFSLSPILFKLKGKFFDLIVIICVLLPILGTRTKTEISIGQFVYFMPVFILGIYFAKNYNIILPKIKKIKFLFLLVLFISSLILFYAFWNNQNLIYHKTNIIEGIFYLQKMSILALMFLAFEKIENVRIRWLDELAKTSFALYFLHLTVRRVTEDVYFYLFDNLNSIFFVPISILYVIFVGLSTYIIAKVSNFIFKNYSKFLIGY